MSTFLNIEEVIELALLGSTDLLQRDKGRMLKFAKFVNEDLKLQVFRSPERQYFTINKRTNSIDMPCEYTQLSSVNIRGRDGNFYPIWRNEKLTGDIVDIAAGRDCSCEHNCGYKVCNTIKGYEAVTEVITDKLPNGNDISFTCVTRKTVDKSGNLVEQKQYPQRVYESGVWVDTVLYTETLRLCAVEVDDNGCACDSEANIDAVCNTCNTVSVPFGGTSENPPCEGVETWRYYCNSKLDWFSVQCGQEVRCHNPYRDIYNISEDGTRLIFPSNFGFDKVMLRWYGTTKTGEIKVPLLAVPTYILGLKWYINRFDDTKQGLAQSYSLQYTQSQWGLQSMINRRRLDEWKMILTPPVFTPSYDRNIRPYTSILY